MSIIVIINVNEMLTVDIYAGFLALFAWLLSYDIYPLDGDISLPGKDADTAILVVGTIGNEMIISTSFLATLKKKYKKVHILVIRPKPETKNFELLKDFEFKVNSPEGSGHGRIDGVEFTVLFMHEGKVLETLSPNGIMYIKADIEADNHF